MATNPTLTEDVQKALALVKALTSKEADAAPKGTDRMPNAELRQCAGVAFTFMTKVGAGVTVSMGDGFVIKKRDGKWSAPFFVKVKSGGLGLTLGASKLETITILDTPEAVAKFAGGQWTLDTEMTGTVGGVVGMPAGGHLGATALNMSDKSLSDKTFTYSIAKGALVDVSWTGVHYSPDADQNKSLYGEAGAAPAGVLDGELPPAEALAELYAALDEAIKS